MSDNKLKELKEKLAAFEAIYHDAKQDIERLKKEIKDEEEILSCVVVGKVYRVVFKNKIGFKEYKIYRLIKEVTKDYMIYDYVAVFSAANDSKQINKIVNLRENNPKIERHDATMEETNFTKEDFETLINSVCMVYDFITNKNV